MISNVSRPFHASSRDTRLTLSLTLAWCVLIFGASVRGEDESARDLFKRVVDNIPKVPFVAKVKLTNQSSVRDLEVNHKQLNEKTLAAQLSVTSPQDVAGTKFLVIEHTEGPDEQYILVPQVGRVVRLVNSSREQQLLGSEFTVSDLTLPDPETLELSFSGGESVNGRQCTLVDVVAKPEAQWQYKKARYAVDPVDLLIMRVELADDKGPFKLWTLDKVEKIDGIWTPRVQRMQNLRSKLQSQLEISEIHYGVDLPDDLFTRNRLERDR